MQPQSSIKQQIKQVRIFTASLKNPVCWLCLLHKSTHPSSSSKFFTLRRTTVWSPCSVLWLPGQWLKRTLRFHSLSSWLTLAKNTVWQFCNKLLILPWNTTKLTAQVCALLYPTNCKQQLHGWPYFHIPPELPRIHEKYYKNVTQTSNLWNKNVNRLFSLKSVN